MDNPIIKRKFTIEFHNRCIVIDLDDTLCHADYSRVDLDRYSHAIPKTEQINKLKEYRDSGFYITILTARNMLTCDGDIEKVLKNVGQITLDWLSQHDVPWDALYFGKPYASHYYIDDKSITEKQFLELEIN